VENETPGGTQEQIDRAYRLALGRFPSKAEREVAMDFLQNEESTLTDFCHTLLTLNEFIYVD
jgi:hypothetical protein